jgi:hypothetical protein
VIEGENSHDAHSFAAKARRGEPISAPEISDLVLWVFVNSIVVNPCDPESGGEHAALQTLRVFW